MSGLLSSCPACLSRRLGIGPASAATGQRIGRCLDCGLRAYANYEPPPLEVRPREEFSAQEYDRYVQLKRADAGERAWHEGLRQIGAALAGVASPRLFDIGAGDAEFLRLARDYYGYSVSGSEIQQGAADLALARNKIRLEVGDLADLGHQQEFDAATMWCVLAHTFDGDKLLAATRDLLKPGGVLYLQTPRRSSADESAVTLARLTRGRVTRLADRRIASHHWLLHTRRSITATLERNGFQVLMVAPRARYSLTSASYLGSLGAPARVAPVLGRAMDAAIERGLSFRIVLDVLARRPA